jgi:hypothetical protein
VSCVGRRRRWNNDIRERLYRIKNRATSNAFDMTVWAKTKAVNDGHPEIVSFINILGEILQREMDNYPLYREVRPRNCVRVVCSCACAVCADRVLVCTQLSIPMAPKLEVDCKGFIQYKEVPRPGVKDMTDYVAEMEKGDQTTTTSSPAAAAAPNASGDQMGLLLEQLRTQKVDPAILASMEKIIEENNRKKKQEEEERLQKTIQPYVFLRYTHTTHTTHDPQHTTPHTPHDLIKLSAQGPSRRGPVAPHVRAEVDEKVHGGAAGDGVQGRHLPRQDHPHHRLRPRLDRPGDRQGHAARRRQDLRHHLALLVVGQLVLPPAVRPARHQDRPARHPALQPGTTPAPGQGLA